MGFINNLCVLCALSWIIYFAARGGGALQAIPASAAGSFGGGAAAARRGVIRYQAIGLAGRDAKYRSTALLKTVALGNMVPAGGDERKNIGSTPVAIALTAEALQSLALHNVFEIVNPGEDSFQPLPQQTRNE